MKYPDIFDADISRVGIAESRAYNLEAAILMAGKVRTSLGPRGMEKMYVDIIGEETITKHGGAFLRKMDVDHPAAKAVADGVNTVDNHVGDGTVSAAILLGELMERARGLMASGIRVSEVTRGYERGLRRALAHLDKIGVDAGGEDAQMRRRVVATCLAGKSLANSLADTDYMIDCIMEAVRCVTDGDGRVNVDLVKIEEKQGSSAEVELVRGTVIDKPADSPAMPARLEDTRVLILNDALEATRTKTESSIEINSPGMMGAFAAREDADVLEVVAKVVDCGAGLVISRKGIGALAQELLARRGIMSVRRAKYNDIWWAEKATGARTCSSVDDILEAELGEASAVYQRTVGGDPMIFIESEAPSSVTLLLRAASKRYLDEFHRTALSAVRSLQNFVELPAVVYGGGSCEAMLAKRLRDEAPYVEGREQAVLEGFADALYCIPRALAANAGMDALDALPLLRSRCAAEPDGWWGIDSSARRVAKIRGAVDTLAVKRQVLRTAVEAANQILGVDDVFVKDLIDNTHCHIDGTVHAHKDPGRNHNHWEQEGLEQRQEHHYY